MAGKVGAGLKNLTGLRFGRLIVVGLSEFRGNGTKKKPHWNCKCDCGGTTISTGGNLRSGTSESCGCYALELVTKHGYYGMREYRIWYGIKDRTTNPNSSCAGYYYNKGIDVDPRWLESFEAFLEDMGKMPSEKHSIDRISNEGGYWAWNCRWATNKEQARNKTDNHLIVYQGQELCLTEWAEKLCIPWDTLLSRIQNGWSIDKAFTQPLTPHKKLLTFNGKTQSVSAWAKEKGFAREFLRERLSNGWNLEDALSIPPFPIGTKRSDLFLTAWGETKNVSEWIKDNRCKVCYVTLKSRLRYKWDVERALSTPPTKTYHAPKTLDALA